MDALNWLTESHIQWIEIGMNIIIDGCIDLNECDLLSRINEYTPWKSNIFMVF